MGIRDYFRRVNERYEASMGFAPTADLSSAERRALADMAEQGRQQLAEGHAFGDNKLAPDIQQRIEKDVAGDVHKEHLPARREIFGYDSGSSEEGKKVISAEEMEQKRTRSGLITRGTRKKYTTPEKLAESRERHRRIVEEENTIIQEAMDQNALSEMPDRVPYYHERMYEKYYNEVVDKGFGCYAEAVYADILQQGGHKGLADEPERTDTQNHCSHRPAPVGAKTSYANKLVPDPEVAHSLAIIENAAREAHASMANLRALENYADQGVTLSTKPAEVLEDSGFDPDIARASSAVVGAAEAARYKHPKGETQLPQARDFLGIDATDAERAAADAKLQHLKERAKETLAPARAAKLDDSVASASGIPSVPSHNTSSVRSR